MGSACSVVVPLVGAVCLLDSGVAEWPAVNSAGSVAGLVADFAETVSADFVDFVVLAGVEVLALFEFDLPFEDSVAASDLDSEVFQ